MIEADPRGAGSGPTAGSVNTKFHVDSTATTVKVQPTSTFRRRELRMREKKTNSSQPRLACLVCHTYKRAMLCKSTAQHKGTMLRTCVRALYKTGQAGLNFQHARGRPVAVSLVKDCCLNSLQPAVLSKSMRSRRLESRVYARLINANVRKRGGETRKSKREKKRKKSAWLTCVYHHQRVEQGLTNTTSECTPRSSRLTVA